MSARKVFHSAAEYRWHEHREQCKAAVGQMVYIPGAYRTGGAVERIEVKLIKVGRTLATISYPNDPDTDTIGLDRVELL